VNGSIARNGREELLGSGKREPRERERLNAAKINLKEVPQDFSNLLRLWSGEKKETSAGQSSARKNDKNEELCRERVRISVARGLRWEHRKGLLKKALRGETDEKKKKRGDMITDRGEL